LRKLSECARVLASLFRTTREDTRRYSYRIGIFFHKGSFQGAAKPISIGAFGFRVFTITALAGYTFTSLYVICSTGFKQNSYDFFGLCFTTENRKIKNPQISQISADS